MSVDAASSKSRIWFMPFTDSTTPPLTATLPPALPVPAPRTVTATPSAAQSFMTADTSSAVLTSTTASGIHPTPPANSSCV